MINPQPVSDYRSPYSSTQGSSHSPRPLPPVNEPPKKRRSWRRILGFTFLTLFIATATYAYARYSSFRNNIVVAQDGQSSAILAYDPNDKGSKLDPTLFSKFGDGRFNMVVVGVGGEKHKGSYLTDSIQVISLDTINKKITLTSLPRDLYVTIPGYGRTKINNTYQIGEKQKKGGGPALVREVVGNVLGAKVSNFTLIDFTGVKELVDALGGIEVTVPKAIYDPYYPDDKTEGYEPFTIAAGVQKMDGHTALRYSRSRKTTSDFDRSMRQQLVMEAIKQKTLSAGVLSNPVKINNLLKALEKHIRTDMQFDQQQAFFKIYKDVTSGSTTSHVLDTSSSLGLLTSTTDPVAGYIAYPPAGFDKFEAINQWFAKNSPDPLLARETPTITVVSGGKATDKQVQELVARLKDYGYNAKAGTALSGKTKYTETQVFIGKTDTDKPFSKNYLSSMFSTKATSGSPANSISDFEIVYVPSSTTNAKAAATKTPTKAPTSTPSPTNTP